MHFHSDSVTEEPSATTRSIRTGTIRPHHIPGSLVLCPIVGKHVDIFQSRSGVEENHTLTWL